MTLYQKKYRFFFFYLAKCELFCMPLPQKRRRAINRASMLNLHLALEKKSLALSHPKELSVCLGPINHKLDEVQSKLNRCGLTNLIIKLITNNVPQEVVLEAVKLAVALLKGGHREVQESFWKYLSRSSSEDFFKEIHSKFQEAQMEIKNTPLGLAEVRGQWVWYGSGQ